MTIRKAPPTRCSECSEFRASPDQCVFYQVLRPTNCRVPEWCKAYGRKEMEVAG